MCNAIYFNGLQHFVIVLSYNSYKIITPKKVSAVYEAVIFSFGTDDMRLRSSLSALFCTTALLGTVSIIHPASAADSQDAQLRELRREMLEMRSQIKALKSRLNEPDTNTRTARVAAAAHRSEMSNRMAHDINIGEPVRPSVGVLNSNGAGTPPSDRAVVESWRDFQAATKSDEEVAVGGMKIGFPNGRFTVQSKDGEYALSIGLAFHEDFGGFITNNPRGNEAKGAFNAFTTNQRRLRIPFMFRYKNWVAAVTPDFGANHNDGYVGLYEGNLNYTGLRNTVLTVGYFQPRVTEEDAESSNDFMTLERPSITDMVRNIAAGDARFSVGGMHYEKRWWIAGYFTGQEWGHRNPSDNGATYYGGGSGSVVDSQTGGVFRFAGRPIATKDWDLHMGVSAMSAFKVQGTGSHNRTTSFGQRPEFDIGEGSMSATGTIPFVSHVWAAGPELGLRWRRLLVKGEYYHVGIERSQATLPTLNFQGWYGAAAYTIFGTPRMYNYKEGAWGAPGVKATEEFDPAHNQWGALEVVGHYSVIDLNDNAHDPSALASSKMYNYYGVNGGQQTVWQGGLNWYPNRHFAIKADYSHFIVSRSQQATNTLGRTGDSVEARVQATF